MSRKNNNQRQQTPSLPSDQTPNQTQNKDDRDSSSSKGHPDSSN